MTLSTLNGAFFLLLVRFLFERGGGCPASVSSKISMGKHDGSRTRNHRINFRGLLGGETMDLRIGYWNCNGLKMRANSRKLWRQWRRGGWTSCLWMRLIKYVSNSDMSAFGS